MKTLNELISTKMQVCEQEGRNGTKNNYRTLLHYIEKNYGMVPMKHVNVGLVKRMKKQMTQEGKSPSTISNYFALLSCIFNYAVYAGYAKAEDYPFQRKSYELDKVKRPKMQKRTDWWLKKEQLRKMYDEWEKATNKSDKRCVGLFLASYLCNGANLADILSLRYDSNYMKNDGKVFMFVRKKTQGRSDACVTIPIIPELKTIIEEIGDKEKPNGLVFGSFISNIKPSDGRPYDLKVTYWNAYASKVLRRFCGKIGISENVSMSWARHSYATILNHEGCNYSSVELALGHVLPGVSSHYIGKATIESLFEMNSKLLS